jgi:hypothetical protein
MDDASTNLVMIHDNVFSKPNCSGLCCHFCGKSGQIVDFFPRRDYARRSARTPVVRITP